MSVKVAKFLGSLPVAPEALDSLVAGLTSDKEVAGNVLEVFISRAKEGGFVASVAYVGESTSEEVKAMLDKGQIPKIFSVDQPEPEALPEPEVIEKPCREGGCAKCKLELVKGPEPSV